MIDQHIFEDLQNKIDEETQVREVSPLVPNLRLRGEFFAPSPHPREPVRVLLEVYS